MYKRLIQKDTLVYYDLPHVLTAVDEVETTYVCMLVDETEEGTPIFLSTAISPSRLSHFMKGQVDLRSIFTQAETSLFYLFENLTTPIEALLYTEDIPEDFLPEEGFFLDFPVSVNKRKRKLSRNKLANSKNISTSKSKDYNYSHYKATTGNRGKQLNTNRRRALNTNKATNSTNKEGTQNKQSGKDTYNKQK